TRKKIKFFAEVKGVGYRTYYIEEGKASSANAASTDINTSENSIENNTIKIIANIDGTVSYYNKSSKTKIQNVLNILDEGNAGDSYDYSPPRKDNVIDSRNFESEIKIEKINDFEAEMKISKVMEVNKNTDDTERSNKMVAMKINMVIKINTNSRYFDLDVSVDNQANNHRVSLYIPNFTTTMHFREGSFGDVKTSNVVDYQNTLDMGWKELCYPIYPTQRYVYDIDSKLAVFNKGIQSYEIMKENDLKIHLLTTMDYMGKKDLLYRPGRRSGAKIYTPDSLLIGKHEFNFRFLLFDDKNEIYSTSDQFQTNLFGQYFHKPNSRGFMSDELTAFSILNKSVSTSALMKSQFEDGIIWRVKNMSNDVIDSVGLKYNSNLYEFDTEVNLLEEKRPNDRISEEMTADYIGEEYEGSGELFKTGKLTIHDLKPNEFINLKFKINKLSI
ncbi:glycoside hydrolase family 38 C-terminal domain-containing protein, partial [Alkalibacterium sp. 20]|uniref:glycoside hydrolase family 38 C-terminal domain-containing protein n=1 Tax=Alkalibacterium sp. 20 TaxID=1798803 RepID=UPI000AC99B0E